MELLPPYTVMFSLHVYSQTNYSTTQSTVSMKLISSSEVESFCHLNNPEPFMAPEVPLVRNLNEMNGFHTTQCYVP
jgi:hypothetical protein